MSQSAQSPFRQLVDAFERGEIGRRQFLARAAALGVSVPVALFLANASPVIAAGGSRNGFAFYAQDATPTTGASGFPDAGMEGRTRGEGGELRLIQWQAPTLLNAHRATGTKDFMASDIVNEPLMRYAEDGSLLPNLITEVPSVENGQLAEDLSSATFSLLPDVVWSDGEPFTARDVQFTWQWITTESNAAISFGIWDVIENIEVVDDLTATVTYKTPSAAWFDPFTGGNNGHIYPAHAFGDDPANANDAFTTTPIGTGPYVVTSFTPNDLVTYVANENYRDPNKPFFSDVTIKGGGDAASAARAVLQTGEFDYAWNLQVEPDVLNQMEESGGQGEIVTVPGTSVERIHLNFSDPNTEVDGQRSHLGTPHPFLTDPAVREAISTAVDRELIAMQFYGEGNPAAKNYLSGIPALESPNTSFTFDTDAANQMLEDTGWTGGTRSKDGVELQVTYATSINQVRQKTQAVVKDNLADIGIEVTLEQVDAGIYFDSGAGNEQNINHFYWDFDMYQSVPSNPTPISYMEGYYAGPDNENVAQASNDWSGQNYSRYVNPDYDALLDQARTEPDPEKLADLFIQMNDILITNHVTLPLVVVGSRTGIGERLREENLALGAFSYNYWNIANWNLAEGFEPE